MPQSRKILRIFFKNLDFHVFCDSCWRLICGWKVQSRGVYRDFRGSTHDFLAGRPSSREKNLEKISRILFSKCFAATLATGWRLGSVVKIACFAYWRLFSRSFSETFHFSLMHHYHCSYLRLLPSFLIDPIVYSCQKGGEILFLVHIYRGRNSLYLSFYYLLYLEGLMCFVQVFQVTGINVPSSSQLLWFIRGVIW